jgi:predicted nucleic acid-binding protein
VSLPNRLAIDTNCFVYLFESEGSRRAEFLASEVFGAFAVGKRTGVTSTLTIAELLVRPYEVGDSSTATALRSAMEGMPGLDLLGVDLGVADDAARIRGRTGLYLADAVQVATALRGRADALLTNDRHLADRADEVDVIVLDEVVHA